MKLTPKIDKAIKIAATAHKNQNRKGTKTPYIIHPFAVMCIASEVTNDENTLVACLLHDVLEDVPDNYSRSDMHKDFGGEVVKIVEGVTKDNSLPSWQDRANAYLAHLQNDANDMSVIVSAADKIHNLMSIISDYNNLGDELWLRFNSTKEQQLWWYESVLDLVNTRIPNSELNAELRKLVFEYKKLF